MNDHFVWPSDADRAENDELNRVCEYLEGLLDRLEIAESRIQVQNEKLDTQSGQGVEPVEFQDYDAGMLNDWGGGNVSWWLDYLRAEIERANNHWREQTGPLPLYTHPQPAQHPDDAAVDRFAEAMKAKLAKKRAEGRAGWEDPQVCPSGRLQQMLIDHLTKGDPVDIGNFAMMIWNRGEAVAGQPAQQGGIPDGWSLTHIDDPATDGYLVKGPGISYCAWKDKEPWLYLFCEALASATPQQGSVPSRDDLIQCLLATQRQSEGVMADAILSMFTGAPTVPQLTAPQPEGDGWIKCSERLPKLGQRVQLFSQGVIQHMMPLFDDSDEGLFWDFEVHDYNPPVDMSRDQWRPLPQPPKEGE